ncbi:MAG: hypothetical protein RIR26_2671 [Pseudomonadota bacterium]
MKFSIVALSLFSILSVSCHSQNATISSKKNDDGKRDAIPKVAQQVHSLKEGSGKLNCAGMDEKLRFMRTIVAFQQGKLTSLVVSQYEDTSANKQPLNDLTPNLKKFEIYSSELTPKIVDFRKDLDGKHFQFEAYASVDGLPVRVYDLDIRAQSDGEGGSLLAATLEYKDVEAKLDVDELFLSCVVLK